MCSGPLESPSRSNKSPYSIISLNPSIKMHLIKSLSTGLLLAASPALAIPVAPGPPGGFDESCAHLGLSSFSNAAYTPNVWSSATKTLTYKAVALYNAINTQQAQNVWNAFTCNNAPSGPSCANNTIQSMLYNAMLDVSSKSISTNYANIQVLNSSYWQGFVGEDDGQGSSSAATSPSRQSSYTYDNPSAYGSPGFTAPNAYIGSFATLKITCKNGAGTANNNPLDAADLGDMAYRISNRMVISNFFAWRFAVYSSATNNVYARCRITISPSNTNGYNALNGNPDFIPVGGASASSNDGAYPIESTGGMPCA